MDTNQKNKVLRLSRPYLCYIHYRLSNYLLNWCQIKETSLNLRPLTFNREAGKRELLKLLYGLAILQEPVDETFMCRLFQDGEQSKEKIGELLKHAGPWIQKDRKGRVSIAGAKQIEYLILSADKDLLAEVVDGVYRKLFQYWENRNKFNTGRYAANYLYVHTLLHIFCVDDNTIHALNRLTVNIDYNEALYLRSSHSYESLLHFQKSALMIQYLLKQEQKMILSAMKAGDIAQILSSKAKHNKDNDQKIYYRYMSFALYAFSTRFTHRENSYELIWNALSAKEKRRLNKSYGIVTPPKPKERIAESENISEQDVEYQLDRTFRRIRVLNNNGRLYFTMLNIRRARLGFVHPDTINSYEQVGTFLLKHQQEDRNKGLAYLEQATEETKELFGMYHRHTAKAFFKTGYWYLYYNNECKGSLFLSMALDILEHIPYDPNNRPIERKIKRMIEN